MSIFWNLSRATRGCVRIRTATVAFRMGVGCNQVHLTIKFGPAKNVKAYIQEKGRAGTDKTQTKPAPKEMWKWWRKSKKLFSMQ